jgi:hypothetical protein
VVDNEVGIAVIVMIPTLCTKNYLSPLSHNTPHFEDASENGHLGYRCIR